MTALRDTMEGSDIPPKPRLGDFVALIRGELQRVPDMGALNLEFQLYALRNPARRARMNELEQEDIDAIAEIITAERQQRGIQDDEPAERTAGSSLLSSAASP